jgi:sodium-coupled neutral amino acid transporter 11
MCANKHSYPTNVTQLTEKTATHSKRRGYSVVESPQRMVSEPILQSVPELDDNTFPLEEIITPTEVDAPILQTFKLEDLKKQTKTKDKVGVMTSVWNLINDIMTPATISIAFYVAQCGLVLSLILLCIFSLITVYTLCILYDLSKAHKRKSLPDLCSYAFGRPGYYIASLCIFTFNFGGCLISTLMLGELVPALLRDQLGVDHFLFGRTAVMCYLTAVMLPITMRKKLSGFAFTSFISVGTLAVIGVLIMYRAVIDRGEIPEPKEPLVWFSRNAVLALGGLSYT